MSAPNLMYIDGAWVGEGRRKLDVIDPATEERIDTIPVATDEDIDAALDAAQRGFEHWRGVDAWTRSRILHGIADWIRSHIELFADTLTSEQGKPLAEARGEIGATADQFEWYAEEAKRIYGRVVDGHSRANRLMVIRQPIGPVAAFSPWNFPALLTSRKMAPAIAAGCSIVVKPAEEAPRTALLLAKACEEAGLPRGVVNMLLGEPSHISERLIRSDVIRKVSITGSVPVGRTLMRLCAEGIKPITLELGGHSPVLVFEDCDFLRAAELCARGKFRNNGQVCISASRFFVQESVAGVFIDRFRAVTESLSIGPGRAPHVDVGPLSNRRRLDATEALVRDAVDHGAVVACGGHRAPGFDKGFFFQPTVLQDVSPEMRIMREEPFCPVAPIATFRDLGDALVKANATEYGLAGYVFTNDMKTAYLASEGLDVGMVGVNNLVIATAEMPFGGVKASGFGREGGTEWAESYTVTKYINFQL